MSDFGLIVDLSRKPTSQLILVGLVMPTEPLTPNWFMAFLCRAELARRKVG